MDKTYEAIIAGAKADGSWDKKYPYEDDDIQDYKKPWVGLTDEDCKGMNAGDKVVAMWANRILKEKNT